MSFQFTPLRGFKSDPGVVACFALFHAARLESGEVFRAAHFWAASALRDYILRGPSQKWLARLRSSVATAELNLDRGGIYALVSPASKLFYIGQTNNFNRRLTEHLKPNAKNTARSTARAHKFMRGAGAGTFVMVPLVYSTKGDNLDHLERTLIRRLQPPLNTLLLPRLGRSKPRPSCRVRAKQHQARAHKPVIQQQEQRGYQRRHGQPPQLPALFQIGTELAHEPRALLQGQPAHATPKMFIAPGSWRLVRKDHFLHEFGASQVVAFTRTSILSGALKSRTISKHLQEIHCICFVTVNSIALKPRVNQCKMLLGTAPTQFAQQLHLLPPAMILRLHKHYLKFDPGSRLNRTQIMKLAQTAIDKHIRERFGFELKQLIFEVPPYAHVSTATIRKAVQRSLAKARLPKCFVSHFSSTLFVKRIQAPKLVDCPRKLQKELTMSDDKPEQCRCHELPPGFPRDEDGHVAFRANGAGRPFPVLCRSNKERAEVAQKRAAARLNGAINKFVESMAGRFGAPRAIMRMQFPGWEEMHKAQPIPHQDALTLSGIHETCKQLKQMRLVALPLDRNNRQTWLECITRYDRRVQGMFIQDEEHYRKHQATAEETHAGMKREYQRDGLEVVSPWDKSGTLPRPHVMPKHKDPLNKSRPIVPCHKHPAKMCLRAVGKVWMHIVLSISSTVKHFNIISTAELKSRLEQAARDLSKQMGRLQIFSFDVKNMFTELPHDVIRDASRDALQCFMQKKGSEAFHVDLKKGTLTIPRSTTPSPRNVHVIRIEKKHLLPAVEFELNNIFMVVGTTVLQQTAGVPMGGFMSPALAMLVCMQAENKLHKDLGRDARLLAGARYMDDGSVIVKKASEAQYKRIKEAVLSCYPEGMEALVTGDGLATDMLENRLVVTGDRVESYHRLKNSATLLRGEESVFTTFFPHTTWIGRKYFKGWVMGGFNRLRDNTSWCQGGKGHLVGLYLMYREARGLGYPPAWFGKALRAFQPGFGEVGFHAGRQRFLKWMDAQMEH